MRVLGNLQLHIKFEGSLIYIRLSQKEKKLKKIKTQQIYKNWEGRDIFLK